MLSCGRLSLLSDGINTILSAFETKINVVLDQHIRFTGKRVKRENQTPWMKRNIKLNSHQIKERSDKLITTVRFLLNSLITTVRFPLNSLKTLFRLPRVLLDIYKCIILSGAIKFVSVRSSRGNLSLNPLSPNSD